MIRHRESVIPLITMDGKSVNNGKSFIILIGIAQMRAGLITERIIGEEELVIKALDDRTSTGIASGASILGDGRVVLILDPLYLMKKRMHDTEYKNHPPLSPLIKGGKGGYHASCIMDHTS